MDNLFQLVQGLAELVKELWQKYIIAGWSLMKLAKLRTLIAPSRFVSIYLANSGRGILAISLTTGLKPPVSVRQAK